MLLLAQCNDPIESKTIKSIYIECDAEAFAGMYENYEDNQYIPITIAYNGQTWTKTRMRVRGDTSREDPKKSLKVQFDSLAFENGADVLNFNAEYSDKSYIRQYLSSRLMQEANQVCFQSEHVKLYLNGKYLGLYLMVENVNKDFLKARDIDHKGNLYKATKDGACLSVHDDIQVKWEKKTNAKQSFRDLEALITALNNVSDEAYYDFAQRTFDYDKMVNILALNMLLGNGSTYYHNYYMYHDSRGTGKWEMFPWDMDKSISYYEWMPFAYHRTSSNWESDNPMVERAFMCEPIMNDIKARLKELHQTICNEAYITPIIDSLETVLLTAVQEDSTDKINDIKAWQEQLKTERGYFERQMANLQFQFDHLPAPFRVERMDDVVVPENIRFAWHPSKSPLGKSIAYTLYYGPDFLLEDSLTTQTITGITDTTYHLQVPLTDGKYYWKVSATDGEHAIDGFNTKNVFTLKQGTELPCKIEGKLVLTAAASPYVVNCEELLVGRNASLVIEKGVEVRLPEGGKIMVHGQIVANGTHAQPVRLMPKYGANAWEWLYLMNPDQPCSFNNVRFEEGILNSKYADVTIDSCWFNIDQKNLVDGDKRAGIIWVHHGNFKLTNSTMLSNGYGEGINVNFASALVENCYFYNAPDAIEYINVHDGAILNNFVEFSPDDAIDLNGCRDVLIRGNILQDNTDKGISIGTEQYGATFNTRIEHNLIVRCNTAIAVKDSSTAVIDHNTLYDNNENIRCYRKRSDYPLGGSATVTNTIIAGVKGKALQVDEHSSLSVAYSLCDTEALPGNNNVQGDPEFIDATHGNFYTSAYGAGVGKGSGGGSIGGYPYGSRVVINEFNYLSSETHKSGDWVELYNNTAQPINLSGWELADTDAKNTFIIPHGTIIQPLGYLVLCESEKKFRKTYPHITNYVGNTGFGIKSSGETIMLYNAGGKLVDEVSYNESWPSIPEEGGASIELTNPISDNGAVKNWLLSNTPGTPGKPNQNNVR